MPVPLSVSERDFLTFDQIPADLNRAIVPMVEMTGDTEGSPLVTPVGTAFIIGHTPAGETLLVTAAHNIPEPSGQNDCHLVILLPKLGASAEIVICRVSSCLEPQLLRHLPTSRSWSPLSMKRWRLRADSLWVWEVPAVGENCLALGYSTMRIGNLSGLNGHLDIGLSSSRGKIEEVHPSFRDNVKVTFPSFRTDALYSRGMSGGPVLGTSGRVIGIVSTCMESSEKGIPHTSYCALVAGLFELDVPVGEDSEITLAGLRDAGLVVAEGVRTVIARADRRATVSWPESESDFSATSAPYSGKPM